MLNTSTYNFNKTLPFISLPKPFVVGSTQIGLYNSATSVGALFSRTLYGDAAATRACRHGRRGRKALKVKADYNNEQSASVKAIISVKQTIGRLFETNIEGHVYDIFDNTFGISFLLDLVSAEADPKTGEPMIIEGKARRQRQWFPKRGHVVNYEGNFRVPPEFGEVGAVLVLNEHETDMYITDILLEGLPSGPLLFTCNSYVHSKFDSSKKRVFFTNKSYLPSQTPSGLTKFRKDDLINLRGDGEGERKYWQRIYDYAFYNDLGNPDKSMELSRPVLGGNKNFPYPRRCRTGRPSTKTEPWSESRSKSPLIYVPCDERFSDVKWEQFGIQSVRSALHHVIPPIQTAFLASDSTFPYFTAIDLLFNEGIELPDLEPHGFLKDLLPRLIRSVSDLTNKIIRYELPEPYKRNDFFWLSDEEFARQTLAGLNPLSIKCVTEWPLKSNLEPSIYGPPESALTTELVEKEMKGSMTVEQALKEKKLFIIDYHDALFPFVNKVRELEGTTLYGSRTLFFLDDDEILRPIAIELAQPPFHGKPQWKKVYTPGLSATPNWYWMLAKTHASANDAGYHQLISHWLRTHCCTEPYIIAANRQLSSMHPIYRLLHPHWRYNMEINALAREALINAGGVIERTFSTLKYSMKLSSVLYGSEWRFDHQGLPADLISRGMAVEDPSSPHGVKLTIEDYPYAKDGLDLWGIIKEWVTDYVNHYYPDPTLVERDEELQAWWTEVRTVGHGDKKDAPWWPKLETAQDVIQTVTTIVWVASAQHAAVNFGQYCYGAYFPARPTIARTNMPLEDPVDDKDENSFDKRPVKTLLQCFPNKAQATTVMTVLDVLSAHSPDEEYLGYNMEPFWEEVPEIESAFEKFDKNLTELDAKIDSRNANDKLKNRCGVGVVPYELLKRYSKPGVTNMGVPNSVSI